MSDSPTYRAKRAAGQAAAALIESGMLVGLGTGSTAECFIHSLIERCRTSDLQITAAATSERSAQLAAKGGIKLCDMLSLSFLDITVDGADEIDPKKRMIKGGGGALLREKIIAGMSNEMVVIVDEEKLVANLGKFPLPLEILPFACEATLHRIASLGYPPQLRKKADGTIYLTDNGNYIADVTLPQLCQNPEEVNTALRNIPGVLETGFFINMAGRVLVGHQNGHVQVIE